MKVPNELIDFIKTGSTFIVAGHMEPDGDCVGSQLALCSALSRMGKKVLACSAGPFKRSEVKKFENKFTDTITSLSTPTEIKTDIRAIVVDSSTIERTGKLQGIIESFPYAVIDHHDLVTHPPSTPQAPVYIDSNASSCTILIEKIIFALGLELTEEEAYYLFFGLCTDTGFFRHLTEKNAESFEAAARMIHRGVSPKKVYSSINSGKSLKSRILMGHILSRTESLFDGKLLMSYETLEDYMEFGAENRDSDALNQLLQSIKGVEAIVIIRQEPEGNCSVSFRSLDSIDVAKISANFGGGGHKNASGLLIKSDPVILKKLIIESFSEVFHEPHLPSLN